MANKVIIEVDANTKKAQKNFKELSGSMKGMKAQTAGLSKSFAGLNKGMAVLGIGGLGFAVVIKTIIQRSNVLRQTVASTNLIVGGLGKAAEDTLARLSPRFTEIATEYGFLGNDAKRAMAIIMRETDRARVSVDDLRSVFGLARSAGIDFEQAAGLIGKAILGDVGPLEAVIGRTKSWEEAQQRIISEGAGAVTFFDQWKSEMLDLFDTIAPIVDVAGTLADALGKFVGHFLPFQGMLTTVATLATKFGDLEAAIAAGDVTWTALKAKLKDTLDILITFADIIIPGPLKVVIDFITNLGKGDPKVKFSFSDVTIPGPLGKVMDLISLLEEGIPKIKFSLEDITLPDWAEWLYEIVTGKDWPVNIDIDASMVDNELIDKDGGWGKDPYDTSVSITPILKDNPYFDSEGWKPQEGWTGSIVIHPKLLLGKESGYLDKDDDGLSYTGAAMNTNLWVNPKIHSDQPFLTTEAAWAGPDLDTSVEILAKLSDDMKVWYDSDGNWLKGQETINVDIVPNYGELPDVPSGIHEPTLPPGGKKKKGDVPSGIHEVPPVILLPPTPQLPPEFSLPKDPSGRIPRDRPGGMALGGIVRRPTMALLGEAGPEAVIPLSGGGGIGGGRVNVTINNPVVTDESMLREMARQIKSELEQEVRRGLTI